jgi:hypothetical protein
MTKSCATHKGPGRDPGRGAALALQGGGAHGAFTWGVLDRLLEEGLEVHAICGVSSGARIGATLAQGLGRDGTRVAMRRLWQRLARAHAMSPLQSAPLERWLWGWDLSNSVVWRGLEATMRLFSPAQPNATPWAALWPFDHHPLRALLVDPVEGTAGVRRPITPAGHLAQNPDRDPVIPLTSRPAVRGYHCLTSHTSAAHRVAASNSVQPCV